ncbi:tyrosine-type recombinase/integrase [Sphingorhabdus sp.]|jgi:integrase/recombinase XerD|uniref:tyrosine-type recombinase/integrase n=1 Tax=Sphingorhabdus sp. TaxID=1902408 RepID=UPI0037C844C6
MIDRLVENYFSLFWRRAFATRLNAAGIGVAAIQQAMGHANIASTFGYCWVSDEQLANAVNLI